MELDWQKYIEIADKFQHKAKAVDRADLRQDIILRLAEVASSNSHKPFSEGAMVRVASYTVMAYWRDLMRKPTILSLNSELDNGDGDTVELWQTIADDRAIDMEAWQDAKRWLLGCPKWGGMSIVDTKPFILPVIQHSIFGHKLPAIGNPA